MKRIISLFLCFSMIFSTLIFGAAAADEREADPVLLYFNLTEEYEVETTDENNTRATGLITSYSLNLSKSGTTLYITGNTRCISDVVKCGFKDLVVQRRKTSSDSWSDYYDYGNVYADVSVANFDTALVVASGYQYRVSCKHYAKKSLLSTQSVSNTSNIVIV